MKKIKLWNGGWVVNIGGLEGCILWWRNDGYCHQYKVRYGFLELVGEPNKDNKIALNNVIKEIKTRFKLQ